VRLCDQGEPTPCETNGNAVDHGDVTNRMSKAGKNNQIESHCGGLEQIAVLTCCHFPHFGFDAYR
jgi:hypothetical protein